MTEMREYCIRKTDAGYPAGLLAIRNPPEKLYVRGALPAENAPVVAIIGARRCSSYGELMAGHFSAVLAQAGIQIVSGMAAGIDGIAQRAALEAGGKSFAILGCGTDICYPESNRTLYDGLLSGGGIISEYPAGSPPLPMHFPARNRIISALADVVLVIEAKEKSGSLITVDFALEQGRDVYVLPGRITDELSRGCNRLLLQGAGLALSPEDILEALYGRGKQPLAVSGGKTAPEKVTEKKAVVTLTEREQYVLENMGERPISLPELFEKTGAEESGENLSLPELTAILMGLVIRGIVSKERGNHYQRKMEIGVSSI